MVITSTAGGLAPPYAKTMSKRFSVSDDDLAMLRRWSEENRVLSARARVILASHRGQKLASIVREAGISRCAVCYWRKRFREDGLRGLAPKAILAITEEQRSEMARWLEAGGRPAQKAKVILEVARMGDVEAAARNAGVCLETARKWRRTFVNLGLGGLRSRVESSVARLVEMTPDSRASLAGWAQVDSPLGIRASALLSLAEGQSVDAVSERLGARRASVLSWARRFDYGELPQMLRKHTLLFTPEQKADLAWLLESSPANVAKRVAALLQWAETGDLEGAAENGRVACATVLRWKRAYDRLGRAGLAYSNPKRGMAPPVKESVAIDLQLKAELRVETTNGPAVGLRGQTTNISNHRVKIALKQPPPPLPYAKGARVSGRIQWPVLQAGHEPIVLAFRGILLDAEHEVVTIRLRKATLHRRAELSA